MFIHCPFPLISSSVFVMSVLIVSRRSSKEIHLQLGSAARTSSGGPSRVLSLDNANKLSSPEKECEKGKK